MRLIYLLATMLAIVLAIGPSELLLPSWWRLWSEKPDLSVMVASVFGLSIGALAARPVWQLSTKEASRMQALAQVAATLFILAIFIYLRESGLWPWPLAAGDALLTCATVVLLVAAVATERIKGVKVYLASRSLRVVAAARDA